MDDKKPASPSVIILAETIRLILDPRISVSLTVYLSILQGVRLLMFAFLTKSEGWFLGSLILISIIAAVLATPFQTAHIRLALAGTAHSTFREQFAFGRAEKLYLAGVAAWTAVTLGLPILAGMSGMSGAGIGIYILVIPIYLMQVALFIVLTCWAANIPGNPVPLLRRLQGKWIQIYVTAALAWIALQLIVLTATYTIAVIVPFDFIHDWVLTPLINAFISMAEVLFYTAIVKRLVLSGPPEKYPGTA